MSEPSRHGGYYGGYYRLCADPEKWCAACVGRGYVIVVEDFTGYDDQETCSVCAGTGWAEAPSRRRSEDSRSGRSGV